MAMTEEQRELIDKLAGSISKLCHQVIVRRLGQFFEVIEEEVTNGRTTMYVYIESEPGLWTVGFYDPNNSWHTDSDHDSREEAAKRVAWLNGRSDG